MMGDTRTDERTRILFALCGIMSSGLFYLAFQLWVTYRMYHRSGGWDTGSLNGVDVTGMTAFGDGYLIGALAAVASLLAAIAILIPFAQRLSAPAIGAAGLASFGIALYDALHPWGFVDPFGRGFAPSSDGLDLTDTEPALWAILAVGAALGLAGLALTVLTNARGQHGAHDVPPTEVTEAWA
jgi:hypothetical protein